jgi:hypothetical protein
MFAFHIIIVTFYLIFDKILIKFTVYIIKCTTYIIDVILCRIDLHKGVCKYSEKLILLSCGKNNNNN